ncbi:MAG: hypothetical protein JXQ75_02360 [Phycisphaerae bacterium]|nr:hypothetical protein [Phycisphaerae bacterium]
MPVAVGTKAFLRGRLMMAFLKRHAMIRKTLIIGLFTCVGLVLTGVTWLAHYENRYYEILRLKRESERIPEAERKAKAKELAAKVFRKYQTTENLSFDARCVDYWCNDGTWESKLPMEWWPRRRVAEVSTAMTPERLSAQVLAGGRPVYAFFLNKGMFSQFKWPWNGVPGMRTQYAVDPLNFRLRLRRGVDPELVCRIGGFRRPWIGLSAYTPDWFERGIKSGLWIGSVKAQGEQCDLVLVQWDEGMERERWDAFYINSDGFVVIWDILLYYPHERFKTIDYVYERRIASHYYTNLKADPISPDVFSPSSALVDESRTWRTLTDAESLAELEGKQCD